MADKAAGPATVPSVVVPPVTVVPAVVARMLSITFRPVAGKTDSKRGGTYLANGDIVGCFGKLPLVVADFALEKNGQSITVHMPSGAFGYKRVTPIMGSLTDGDVARQASMLKREAADELIAAHRAGKAALTALSDAVIDAWARANENKTDGPFGAAITLDIA